jgi:hypothetical protein
MNYINVNLYLLLYCSYYDFQGNGTILTAVVC